VGPAAVPGRRGGAAVAGDQLAAGEVAHGKQRGHVWLSVGAAAHDAGRARWAVVQSAAVAGGRLAGTVYLGHAVASVLRTPLVRVEHVS